MVNKGGKGEDVSASFSSVGRSLSGPRLLNRFEVRVPGWVSKNDKCGGRNETFYGITCRS